MACFGSWHSRASGKQEQEASSARSRREWSAARQRSHDELQLDLANQHFWSRCDSMIYLTS